MTRSPEADPRGTEDTVLNPSARATGPLEGSAAQLGRGAALGRYVVLDFIARGGMGEVYAAYDPVLDRRVALKVIRTPRDGEVSERSRARLRLEAQALARLTHPNVVAVHDVDEAQGCVFLAMEFVEGDDLTSWLRTPRTWSQTLEVFLAAAAGLAAAHRAGLVHRDFKPQNVLVGKDGRVRVADFGIARRDDGGAHGLAAVSVDEPTRATPPLQLTGTGMVGTPAYMAPEQVTHGAVDHRADQFSWCVALYEALFGQRPFVREVVNAAGDPQPMRRPPTLGATPAWVVSALERGLAWDPTKRFASMEALIEALTPARSHRRRLWGAVGVAAALVVVGGSVTAQRARRQQRCEQAVAQQAATWAPATREALRQGFATSGAPKAEQRFEASARTLDAWFADWSAASLSSCTATRVRGVQSEDAFVLRQQCLDEQLAQASALIEGLQHLDAKAVARAPDAVRALPRPTTCDDLQALAQRASAADPTKKAAAQALTTQLRKAVAAYRMSHLTEAIAGLTTVVHEADALADPAVQGEAHYSLGLALATKQDFRGAREQQFLAAIAGERTNDASLKARAWASLASIEGPMLGNLEDGQRDNEYALAAASHLSAPQIQGSIHSHISEQAEARGDWSTALNEAQLAVEILGRIYGDEDEVMLAALNNQGLALSKLHRWPEAQAIFERAIAGCERGTGADSLRCASPRMNLGNLLKKMGRLQEAEVALQHVQAVLDRETPDAADVGANASNLAEVLRAQGKHDEALAMTVRADALLSKTLGADHPNVALVNLNLCALLSEQDRWDDAFPHCERALAIMQKKAPTHPVIADLLSLEAEIEVQRKHYAKASALLERSAAQCHGACKPQFEAERLFLQARVTWASTHDRRKTLLLVAQARELSAKNGTGKFDELEAWARSEKLE